MPRKLSVTIFLAVVVLSIAFLLSFDLSPPDSLPAYRVEVLHLEGHADVRPAAINDSGNLLLISRFNKFGGNRNGIPLRVEKALLWRKGDLLPIQSTGTNIREFAGCKLNNRDEVIGLFSAGLEVERHAFYWNPETGMLKPIGRDLEAELIRKGYQTTPLGINAKGDILLQFQSTLATKVTSENEEAGPSCILTRAGETFESSFLPVGPKYVDLNDEGWALGCKGDLAYLTNGSATETFSLEPDSLEGDRLTPVQLTNRKEVLLKGPYPPRLSRPETLSGSVMVWSPEGGYQSIPVPQEGLFQQFLYFEDIATVLMNAQWINKPTRLASALDWFDVPSSWIPNEYYRKVYGGPVVSPFIASPAGLREINDLVPEGFRGTIRFLWDVNAHGQIAAEIYRGGQRRAAILTPIETPEMGG
ncbi:MAG: hypothetical protein KC940_07495 [Candidatus Omnitrophica bacterium]|nr:hypothetical protein [Candidatus Omnitrophota bacterium]